MTSWIAGCRWLPVHAAVPLNGAVALTKGQVVSANGQALSSVLTLARTAAEQKQQQLTAACAAHKDSLSFQ
jgi:hypothetical protein